MSNVSCQDVQRVLAEIGKRYAESVAEFYPKNNGKQPWGYLWAVTLPCEECHRRFPLTGSLLLRYALPAKVIQVRATASKWIVNTELSAL